MKKVLLYFAAAAVVVACKKEKDDNNVVVPDMTLGNVTWAACNVDDFQQFATRPDMYTKFYQWNRSKAWSATDSLVTGWNSTRDTSPTWTVNPCPTGWRLPTHDEQVALNNAGSTWVAAGARGNAVAGRFYGPNHATCSLPDNMESSVFLPAYGLRVSSGALSSSQTGYYWSGTQFSSNSGYNLLFGSTGNTLDLGINKAVGISVRCVK